MTGRRVAFAGLVALLALLGANVATTAALFTDAPGVGSNALSTATLQPPTGLTATAGCQLLAPKITLNWTATTSVYADGYDVYRSTTNGGPYTLRAHVTGRTTVTYTDSSGLNTNTTYYYVLQSTANSWTSANSGQASAKTPLICLV
ncbi:MAG: hypothetical protein WEB06_00280 [Actinomycetota bacterium]